MSKYFILSLLLLTTSIFTFNAYSANPLIALFVAKKHPNCAQALPDSDTGFCASFKVVAQCHCTSSGVPSGLCTDVKEIYKRMIGVFGSQASACKYQDDASYQTCMDDWDCYRLGGRDSSGKFCSGNGNACV